MPCFESARQALKSLPHHPCPSRSNPHSHSRARTITQCHCSSIFNASVAPPPLLPRRDDRARDALLVTQGGGGDRGSTIAIKASRKVHAWLSRRDPREAVEADEQGEGA